MLNDSIIIAKNVPLTFKLTAKEIWVSNNGDVTIVTSQIGPNVTCPALTAEYLDSLCCDFYFGGKRHQNAIADILLLNRLLSRYEYGDFYDSLRYNLKSKTLTIITSEYFR